MTEEVYDQREALYAAGGMRGKALARCMGGSHCKHQPGECTADPAYQATIIHREPEEIPGTLTTILDWYKTLSPRARQSISLADLHRLSKSIGNPR